MAGNHPVLEVNNLKMYFPLPGNGKQVLKAVDDVSFWIGQGETLGLVGESGCGKSTLARAIARLYRPTGGQVLFRGEDLVRLEGERLRQVRRQIQMIFQDPYSSLNPRMRVAKILSEPLQNFQLTDNLESRLRELVAIVGLDDSALARYPHEFSGGQRQRIAIARALALNPALVIADEPLSALDVSIQAQIINLLRDLQTRLDLSYLFISHDLSVVSWISQRVAVMYLGEIVETAPTRELFTQPQHPYTEALLSAIPVPDPRREQSKTRIVLRGDVPSPLQRPPACSFHPRCPYVYERCRTERPLLQEHSPGRWVCCHLYAEPERQPRPGAAVRPLSPGGQQEQK